MSKLSAFRADWAAAKPMQAGEFDTPDDGKYAVVIEGAIYTERKQDGTETDPTIVYTLQIVDGECAGMRFRKYHTIKTVKNLGFLKGDLATLGLVIPSDPEDIPAVLAGARGMVVEVTVKSKMIDGKRFTDVALDKVLKKAAQAPQSETPFDAARYDSIPW